MELLVVGIFLKAGTGLAIKQVCLWALGKSHPQDSAQRKRNAKRSWICIFPMFSSIICTTPTWSQGNTFDWHTCNLILPKILCSLHKRGRNCAVSTDAHHTRPHPSPEIDSCCDIFPSCNNFCYCSEVSGIALSHFRIAVPHSVDLFNIQYFEWLTIALLLFLLKEESNLLQRTRVTSSRKWKILKRSDECSISDTAQNTLDTKNHMPPCFDKDCSSSKKNKNRYNINLVLC